MAETEFKRTVDRLVSLNDDNLAEGVKKNGDVQWCLGELQDILDATDGISAERLIELAKADKEGRAVVFPQKAADVYWVILRFDDSRCVIPCKVVVDHYSQSRGNMMLVHHPTCKLDNYVANKYEFGKSVFYTREEAEKAMEKMNERNE